MTTSACNTWRLTNKKAIVTGAASGVGLSIVKAFLDLGATVLMVDRNAEALAKEKALLKNQPLLVDSLVADVTSASDMQAILEKAKSFLGGIDILVNNVGTNIRKSTLEYTTEDLRAVMAINFEPAFTLSRLCYPLLKQSNSASIINVSSLNSQRVVRLSSAAYSASKAAMEQLSNYLAVEWGSVGIRVNSIHPWAIRTPLAEDAFKKHPGALETIQEKTPLGRIAEPEEIANVVAFLAMPASSYITAANIVIDGGISKVGF